MKLFRSTVNIATLLVAALLFTGCGPKAIVPATPNPSEVQPAPEIGISYSVKDGMLVSAETAKFIGIKTEDVSERSIQTTHSFSARIFRSATTDAPHALASALISAADAAFLRPGLTSIASQAALVAEVMRLDRSGSTQLGMVEVILQFNDPSLTLSEGGFVRARFATGGTNVVTAVPSAALFRTTTGDFVYIENGAHLARAAVTAGRTDGAFTEITDGLFAGDKVVVHPVATLWMTELHNVNGGDACCIKQEAKK